MAKRHSSNPELAYREGIKAGRESGINDGFIAFCYISLLAMYNTNADLEYLNDDQFKKLFAGTESEIQRIFNEEYVNDPMNIADVAIYHIRELRKKMGLSDI